MDRLVILKNPLMALGSRKLDLVLELGRVALFFSHLPGSREIF